MKDIPINIKYLETLNEFKATFARTSDKKFLEVNPTVEADTFDLSGHTYPLLMDLVNQVEDKIRGRVNFISKFRGIDSDLEYPDWVKKKAYKIVYTLEAKDFLLFNSQALELSNAQVEKYKALKDDFFTSKQIAEKAWKEENKKAKAFEDTNKALTLENSAVKEFAKDMFAKSQKLKAWIGFLLVICLILTSSLLWCIL